MIAEQTPLSNTNTSTQKRARLISLDISLEPYNYVQEWIIDAASRRESRTVCCANVHMVIEGKQKPEFAKAVNGADWVLPDGMPLVMALSKVHGIKQDRIAGMDLAISLLHRASETGISVFFYGSTQEVLDRLKQKCQEQFPMLKIAGMISPPFRKTTEEENAVTAEQIKNSGAGLVFVILGCPKQEQWMHEMRGKIPAVMLGLGGALLVLAGYQTRAPYWMRQYSLEWLFRLAQEPRRLFKRYAITNSLYIWHIGKQWLAQSK